MTSQTLGDIKISIQTMKLSGNREELYVSIERGGREVTPHKFPSEYRNRAEYTAAEWRHVLLGEPKPDIGNPIYADPEERPVA